MIRFGQRRSKSSEIAGKISSNIVEGRLQPGEQLPGIREMALSYGVTWQIMFRACHMLAEAGLLIISPRQGCRINPNLEVGVIRERPLLIGYLNYGFPSEQILRPGSFNNLTLDGLFRAATELNCRIVPAPVNYKVAPEDFYHDFGLNAMIISGMWDDELAVRMKQTDIPFLFYGTRILNEKVNHIWMDIENNNFNIMTDILQKHHFKKPIAIIGPESFYSSQLFYKGWRRAMEYNNIALDASPVFFCNSANTYEVMRIIDEKQLNPDFIQTLCGHYPLISCYFFEHGWHKNGRKPFIMLDGWNYNMFFPELVDCVINTEATSTDELLPRMLDIYYGRIPLPLKECISLKPPYYHKLKILIEDKKTITGDLIPSPVENHRGIYA